MAKQGGMGDAFYVGGFDVSGDIGSLSRVGGGPALQDVTGIDKGGFERIGLLRDGSIEFAGFFNDSTGQLHKTLRGLPYADVSAMYLRGKAVGAEAACCVGKQADYQFTRGTDGSLTVTSTVQANGFGIEWGTQLTPGKRTDTAATNGTAVDTLAATSFGGQAYLQVLGFTGTSASIIIQDSADNVTFAAVTGFTFTTVTGVTSERLQLGATATLRRYLRVATTGTFSNLVFAVVCMDNLGPVVF